MLRLNIDPEAVWECRSAAARIARDVADFAADKSTVAVERAILRLLGLDGVDEAGIPWPNRLVDCLPRDHLEDGVCYWIGQVLARRDCSLDEAARRLCEGDGLSDEKVDWRSPIEELAEQSSHRIAGQKKRRRELCHRYPPARQPWFYCIVATGNIHEDVVQARAAAQQGAQVIAVIRSTAQSLLDYVPFGATTEGYAGTFATQENFRIMRNSLDEVGKELGRYIFLCNYASGLCMPEIAAMGAQERLDMMLNDAMYGILFRDINMQRTLIDQFFSRRINGSAGIIINTGEDNYLKTDEGLAAAHTVLASQFINQELALLAGLPPGQIGLGHAFELDPEIEDGFLVELSHALLSRQIFPDAPLKYMPPTRYKTGDIFMGYLQDGLFNLASALSGQQIQLLGMLSEAVQTPGVQDRYLALRNARYILRNAGGLAKELRLEPDGRIQARARKVLEECRLLLHRIAEESLFGALERGVFAGIVRGRDEGRGLEGVFRRSDNYYNPFEGGFGD